jgi:hypothetical protein
VVNPVQGCSHARRTTGLPCFAQEREKLSGVSLEFLGQHLLDLLNDLAGVSASQRSDPRAISLARGVVACPRYSYAATVRGESGLSPDP